MELAHDAESDSTPSPVCSPWDPPCWTFSSPKEYPAVLYTLTLSSYFKPSPSFPSHQVQNSKSQPPQNHPMLQAEGNAISPGFQATQPGSFSTSGSPRWQAKSLTLQFGEQQLYHRQSFCSYGRVAFVF